MIRPLATIVAAILFSRPELAHDEAARYAKIVHEEAKARRFDPLTLVALVRGADFDVYTHRNRIVTGARAHVA